MTAFEWCAPLASASDDVLGAAVREVCTRRASSTPGLLRIGHHRAHELVSVTYGEGNRTVREERSRWWLHIGVVFDGDATADARPIEESHPALARDLQEAALRWADCWPVLHRHGRTDAALREYHRTPLDAAVPATPPVHPRHRAPAAAPVRRAAPVEPSEAAPAAVPEQRGLFG